MTMRDDEEKNKSREKRGFMAGVRKTGFAQNHKLRAAASVSWQNEKALYEAISLVQCLFVCEDVLTDGEQHILIRQNAAAQ